jgi:hypothetical protein
VAGGVVPQVVPPVSRAYFYNPIPDIIVILTDILIIVSFFLPWVTLGAAGYPSQGFSPLRILREGGVAWWVYIIPIALLVAGFIELLLSLFRILSRGKGWWKSWWYFTDGLGYILGGVLWWVLVMYAPAIESMGTYYSLSDFTGGGVQAGFGAGLILVIIGGALEIVAGVVAYAGKRS